MKNIPLPNNKFSIIDDCDYQLVSQYRWRLDQKGYCVARVNGKDIFIHRLILSFPTSPTDHINGNPLDNRRSNLRSCSIQQNNMNRKVNKNNKSGYKGVNFQGGKWHASIAANKCKIHLGAFEEKEQAARAYDKAAKEMHGEFARLNFPED